MKTIEVSDEMYAQLMEISKEMNNQDHMATRMPYLWQVQETKQIPTCDGCGTPIWVDELGGTLTTENEIWEAMINNLVEDGFLNEEAIRLTRLGWSEDKCVEWLEEHEWRRVEVANVNFLSNGFLTLKACKEHIRINSHNLHNPSPYLSHAFRNPEMELVSKFLCELNGGEIHL